MNKKIQIALIIGLLIACLFLARNIYLNTLVTKSSTTPDISNIKRDNDLLKSNLWDTYVELIKDEGIQIDPLTILYDTVGSKVTLSKLVGNSSKLIFRYSFNDCETCIDSVLNKFKNGINKDEKSNVLVIVDGLSQRDFSLKSRMFPPDITFVRLEGASRLGLTNENKGFPLMFILSSRFTVNKFFRPVRELGHQIDEYITYATSHIKSLNK
jgi:hypothetical protein